MRNEREAHWAQTQWQADEDFGSLGPRSESVGGEHEPEPKTRLPEGWLIAALVLVALAAVLGICIAEVLR